MVSPVGSAAAAAGTPSATISASARTLRSPTGRNREHAGFQKAVVIARPMPQHRGRIALADGCGDALQWRIIMKLSRRSFVGGALAAPFIAQPGFGQAKGSVLRVIPHA